MLKNISNEQFKRLALHSAGVNNVLLEVMFQPGKSELAQGLNFDEIIDVVARKNKPCNSATFDIEQHIDLPPAPIDWQEEDRRRRERDLSRLCGRWTIGEHRCGIEIARAGEHFILTHLKRNGRPTDERYVLIWSDGDILYYGYGDRITVLAHNTETDTLMVSPGADYTRVTGTQM